MLDLKIADNSFICFNSVPGFSFVPIINGFQYTDGKTTYTVVATFGNRHFAIVSVTDDSGTKLLGKQSVHSLDSWVANLINNDINKKL